MPLERSPHRQGGAQTKGSVPLGLQDSGSEENELGLINIRKKECVGSTIGPKAATLMKGVNRLLELVAELRDNAIKVPNTKMEIRRGIEMAEAASVKVISDLEGVILLDKEQYEDLQKSSQGNCNTVKADELREDIARVKQNLGKDTTIDMENLLNKKWPEDAYTSTKIAAGDPAAIKVGNSVFWFSKEGVKNQGLLNIVKKGYPEIADVVGDGTVANGYQIIERLIRFKGKDPKLNYCFLVEGESTNDFISGFLKMKEELESEEDKAYKNNVVSIAAVGSIDVSLLRKAAEIVLHGSQLRATFLVHPNSRIAPGRRTGSPKQIGPVQGRLNINSENMSYADMTKIVKETIDLDTIGVVVKNVKEGKNNNLIIFTKDKEGRDTLRQEILDKVGTKIPEMKIDVAGSKTTILIPQIESSVGTEEIKLAISKILYETEHNADTEDIEVNTKDGKWGTKTAEVTLEKTQAAKLQAIGKIKLGWSICTVREKVKILRCYACLKLGHAHYECRQKKGPQNTLRCFKCTLEGHKVEDCKNFARCNTCNVNGHRADSTQCPKLRNRLYKKQI